MARFLKVVPYKNLFVMVLYAVTWYIPKCRSREAHFVILVLCRKSSEALSALDWHYSHVFEHRSKYAFDDGEVILRRSTIDSRCFHPHYLMCDNMKQPFDLIDTGSNILRLNQIFGHSIRY